MNIAHRPYTHPLTHLSCTVVPGPNGSAHMVCDGCGQPFAAFRHPVENGWESPDFEAHARLMRRRARRRALFHRVLVRPFRLTH